MIIKLITITLLLMQMESQCPTGQNCVSCIDTSCSTCTVDLNFCDSCSTGSYLSSNTCVTCPTKCLSCSTNTYCDKCTPGYDREYDSDGNQICVFYWWKWFLIVFGTLIGLVLLGAIFWWIKNKLKDEENVKQVNYQMKTKLEHTEHAIKQ